MRLGHVADNRFDQLVTRGEKLRFRDRLGGHAREASELLGTDWLRSRRKHISGG
jgi:hypothetical protein